MTTDDTDPPRGARAMAVFRWLLVALMALVALASLAYSFELLPGEPASAGAVQYYCPMHPQVVQDHPGDCPICNMTLVERPNEAEGEAPHSSAAAAPAAPALAPPQPPVSPGDVPGLAPVELSLDRVQAIGVRTAPATVEELAPRLETVGVAAADEARMARVHARFSGWIEQLDVAVTGQKVTRGQTLARIYNLELLPAQQEFLAARRWRDAPASSARSGLPLTGEALERDARARLELFGLSAREIDAIAERGEPVRSVAIAAPIKGHVVGKNAVRGARVEPGTELFEIVDLSEIWVLADVYERDIGRVRAGQSAQISVEAFPGRRFEGKVGFIYPSVDSATRTLKVRIELPNPELELRPGMYVRVELRLEPIRAVTTLAEALVDTGEHQYVFLAKPGGRFEPKRVRAGVRVGERVQILEGVEAGDVLVTTANFLIDSESRLRSAIQSTER